MRFGLDENIIEQIKAVFAYFPEIEEAVLYGSRAKGNFKNGSDIDLTLKGESISYNTFNNISLSLDELMLPYLIDLSIYTQIDNPALIDHIKRVGICFYRKIDISTEKNF
ncbi:MAG TPA: nucleotidyltransferase domain-containing protein [Ignavibacteriales bacterium]|nr:nucleotidyltransferase domain-containing protein [Ignavibacteriales bacterium]